jgi:hypothetical protein
MIHGLAKLTAGAKSWQKQDVSEFQARMKTEKL